MKTSPHKSQEDQAPKAYVQAGATDPRNSQTGTDWQAVKARLAEVSKTIARTEELSVEETNRILEQRARQLAQPAALDHEEADEEMVAFRIHQSEFLIKVVDLREVIPVPRIIQVPGTPKVLRGLLNLRGEILPVMQLHSFLGLPEAASTASSRVMIFGEEEAELGILVDAVLDVYPHSSADFSACPESISSGFQDLVCAVTAEGRQLIDGRKLLHDPRFLIDQDSPLL